MIMDWREMSSRPTIHGLHGKDQRGWEGFTGAYSGGEMVIVGSRLGEDAMRMWDGRMDTIRGWCIAVSWLLASVVEYVNFHPSVSLGTEHDGIHSVCIICTYLSGDHD